jgi:glycine/D-amino acid oxidase-like deaminating enzyme
VPVSLAKFGRTSRMLSRAAVVPDPTVGYAALTYWQDAMPAAQPSRRVEPGNWFDVAIIGGGFTGLWTAYHLLEKCPGISIALFEQCEVGFGASGRSAGFIKGRIGAGVHQMVLAYGVERSLSVQQAADSAARDLVSTLNREAIECDLRCSQSITVACDDTQEHEIRLDLEACERIGLSCIHELDTDRLQDAVHSPTFRTGIAEEGGGVLNPVKLARGLAKVLDTRGVTVYERTGSSILRDEHNRVCIETASGRAYAHQAVIATNAWSSNLGPMSRCVAPSYSYAIASEPINETAWSKLGWDGWDALEIGLVQSQYCQRTEDGRIIFGGGDAAATLIASIKVRSDRSERSFSRLQRQFASTFPQIGALRFTHAWGGPIGLTADNFPHFGSLSPRVHYGFGLCSNGIAVSYLGGQILAALAGSQPDDLISLLLVNSRPRRYLAEPWRFVASQLSRNRILKNHGGGTSGVSTGPGLLRTFTRAQSR